VNKPVNLYYFYSCIHIFFYFSISSIFYIFLYFLLFLLFLGLGPAQPTWAGLSPAGPAWSLVQTSDPAGPLEAHVFQITRAWPLQINSKQAAKVN
jgi:hypothetical protein